MPRKKETTNGGKELATAMPQINITAEDVRKYLCPKATEKELYMALNIIKSYNLNPFKREVHIIKYGDSPAQIVVGYEVYLKRAERTGKLNGWSVVVADDNASATITIHRKDWTHPFEWTVYRSEVDKNQSTWKQMPKFMLEKVAIGQGFRLAFPDELGGLPYLREEIDTNPQQVETLEVVQEKNGNVPAEMSTNGDQPTAPATATEPEPIITDKQVKYLFALLKQSGKSVDDLKAFMRTNYPTIKSSKEIPQSKFQDVLTWVNEE